MAKKVEIEAKEIASPYELPDGWKWTRLGDVCEKIKRGKSPKYVDKSTTLVFAQKCNQPDGTISLEKALFLNDDLLPKYKESDFVKDGDVLINSTGTGTIGRVGYFEESILPKDLKLVPDTHVTTVRCMENNSSKFFYFFLKQKESYLELKGVGTTNMKELHADVLENIPFPLPPLSEQQRIVSRIESMFAKLDEATEKAESALESFETRKAAILHKAFTGELTAKWRKDNGVSDDSWEEKTLGDICSKITDGEHSTPKREDEFCGYYLLSARNIHNNEILLDDVDYVGSEEYERIRKRCNPDRNDILISCSGSVGRVCVIQDDNKYVMVRSAAMLKLKEDNSFFVSYMLQSFNVQRQIDNSKKQSCQANLFLGAIKELTIPVPTLDEQKEIVRILDSVLEKERIAKEGSETVLSQIALLKKSILARAFRGEL